LAFLLVVAPAAADTFTVTNGEDAGPGSLRQAIINAEANPNLPVGNQIQITFTGDIDLTTGLPSISTPMAITGTGADSVDVRRDPAELPANQFRLFAVNVAGGETTTIQDLAISGARASGIAGGALIKGGNGTLILDSVWLTDNHSDSNGGAIRYEGGLTSIRNSTLSGNQSDFGGAINGSSNAGAGTVGLGEIVNTTITGNSATSFGGGIYLGNTGRITVNSSTIQGNTADSDNTGGGGGGGTFNASGGTAPTFSVANTLYAGNTVGTSGDGTTTQCGGAHTSSGYNLRTVSEAGCTGFADPTDLVDPNPILGSLGDNGGPTPTIPLLTGSPAINKGDPATPGSGVFPICPADDQRGLLRGGSAGVCDIGAFEIAPHPTSTAVDCAPASIALGAGSSTCTATVTDSFAPVTPTGIVSFGSSGTGTFSTASCALAVLSASQANCSLTYTPTELGSGSHQITGSYGGDTGHNGSQGLTTVAVLTPPIAGITTTATPFDLGAAIKRCKRKFPKGPKRKKCIKRAKRRAQA
jgi:parallel beta-helix repeat protein